MADSVSCVQDDRGRVDSQLYYELTHIGGIHSSGDEVYRYVPCKYIVDLITDAISKYEEWI